MLLAAAAPQWLSTWLTPVTLLGLGAVMALAILMVLWGLLFLLHWPTAKQAPTTVREGPLFPIFVVTCALAAFGIFGMFFIVRNPSDILESLKRLPQTGERDYPFSIAPGEGNAGRDLSEIEPQKIPVSLNTKELVEVHLRSDVNLTISTYPTLLTESERSRSFRGSNEYTWNRAVDDATYFPDEQLESLYVWNSNAQPATLTMTVVTAPIYWEVKTIPATALVIVMVFCLYFLQQIQLPRFLLEALPHRLQSAVQPKISAISLATAKSEMAQPLFIICMVLGCFFLTLFVVLPYNTFGEDIKMMKDSGLTLIMILTILTCLWAASNSISEEIEGRTALTVLSKPVGRWQFILGKFSGICWVAAVMFLLLGLWFLIAICYKPLYDARETANLDPDWQVCHLEMVKTAPGLALGFMEAVVLAAISVAISTRLPMLANFIICISVFALGHLTPMIVKSSIGSLELVVFVARLFATLLPVLEHFDIKPAIAGGVDVPLDYLGWSLLYCILYSTVAMLLALVMFEDRDLA